MTNYPFNIDNNITLPGVSGASQEDMAITALRSAVFAIEVELGITPSGIYPDVRTRLDILESRIQFGVSPLIPNDGYVKSPLFIWNVPQNVVLSISDGYGAPTENRLDGSLYMRGDGSANNELYVRRGGVWYPIQTDLFVANCDLAGTYLCQEVVGIRNKPLRDTLELVSAVEDGYHLTWNNLDGYWEAQTGFIPGHDLAIFSGPYGRTGQTVVGLQGSPLSGVAPTDGYTLVWQASDNLWEPQARAVVFDGYVARVNLRSNRAFQSPIDNTKTGIVNFGTSTNGSGGATGNYSIILGGDRNISSGTHSLVGGGFSNSALDGYSLVLTGNGNTATVANSMVINGVGNTASGTSSTILNGTSNTASGSNSTVSNGTSNVAAANFSGIFNGSNNTISAGSIHTFISSGHDNQITGGLSGEHSIILGGDNNIVNSANNVLIGTTTFASSQGDFSVILSGVTNNVGNLSDYAIILSGISNTVAATSEFSFIGSGNNNTVTGHYASILTADTSSVNALHGMIVNGANNTVTGQYTTILNGNNNTANGTGWGLILDGYNNTVSGSGSFIADGYNNIINGQFSSIINGNFNTINGRNSTILNGANNNIDATSSESSVIVGENNFFINSANTTATGSSNTFTNATSTFVIGTLNNVQSIASFINGSANTLSSGTSFNRIFGSSNIANTGTSTTFTIGNSNQYVNSAANINIFGSSNIADGYSNSAINGSNNIANANFTNVHGQYGKSRLFGQEVRANSRFTAGKIGEAQFSRLILTGTSLSGNSIPLQLQDTVPANITLADGYSYEMNIRVMVVNTAPLTTNPVVPARFVFDVLAHQESTTIAALSDSVVLPQTIINVASTSGFLPSGTIFVTTTNGVQVVTYTGTTGTSFTGCSGGTGTMSLGGAVRALVLDNVNQTLTTPNTSDDPSGATRSVGWSVTISALGAQLLITVDPETSSANYVQPQNTPSTRRAMATVEWRELSRV